jgi:hypothetical protein
VFVALGSVCDTRFPEETPVRGREGERGIKKEKENKKREKCPWTDERGRLSWLG